MVNVGIVGGSGYTGVELLRILAQHPQVNIKTVTSRSHSGRVSDLYPNLRGFVEADFSEPDLDALSKNDIVFIAAPNGTAMRMTPTLLERGVKVIDLSADFRLEDPTVWEKWYGEPHLCPELLDEAIYGLVEVNRAQIKDARLIACPGCYPTAVQLGFLPLLEAGIVDVDYLIADVKSGVSGAGRTAQVTTLMAEVGESFKAYSASGHRHLPEIKQGAEKAAGKPVKLTFVPHLVPMIRGIHATLYTRLTDRKADIQNVFEQRYSSENFVDVLSQGAHPDTVDVRGSNRCQIALHQPANEDTLVVLSVIDNLVKGAAGQAVQSMNLMFGFDERIGLDSVGLYP